ncbi:MAG: DUF882 domain-containing protein [Thermodesulfobacteriota bacterium]
MIRQINRRQLLSAAALTAASIVLPPPLVSWAAKSQHVPRSLSLHHKHTGENLDIVYGDTDGYDREALTAIDHFLKDYRTGEVHSIDPQLLDILASLNHHFDSKKAIEITSGYRSPKTNQQLRNRNRKVAKRSMHMEGKAVDIRMKGVRTRDLRQYALQIQQGGVGYYPRSNFVHVDSGKVRSW